MKTIILAGFGDSLKLVYNSIKEKFRIIGVVKDYERDNVEGNEFNKFLAENLISIFKINDIKNLNPDCLFVVNFNKIIQTELLNGIVALNLHMGLLPKYRGNNANAWAILNGEKNVGYTIHEIIQELDGGDIFYKFSYEIKNNETYLHAKNAINNDICNIAPVIEQIITGKLKRISQIGSEFVYASKLFPEDGIIYFSEKINTTEILNKYKIFAKPLGTGLIFNFKNTQYKIEKLSPVRNYANSKGFNGAVVMKTKEGAVWIKTNDNAISIDEISINNQNLRPSEIFKIGDRIK